LTGPDDTGIWSTNNIAWFYINGQTLQADQNGTYFIIARPKVPIYNWTLIYSYQWNFQGKQKNK